MIYAVLAAAVLALLLILIIRQGEKLMAAIDDLNSAVTRLQASANAIVAKLGAVPPDQTPAIQAATAAVNAVSDHLDAAVNPPAPTP